MCGRSMNLLSNGLRPLSSDELPNQQPDPDEEQSLPSSFCQSIYRKLMRSTDGPLVWGWLKPMLRGQVLYAPRSPTADRLIRTLNQTFAPGISFHSALITWARVSNELKSLFAISNLTARLQHTEPLLPLIFDSTFNSQITFGDPELIDRLSHDQPLLSILHVLGGTAECFELNRFVGFDSELEMEEAAKQLTKTQQLIAGVVFLNLDDPQLDLLPDQVHYKIRADVDFVPSTKLLKERIWEPGAKDNFGKDLGRICVFGLPKFEPTFSPLVLPLKRLHERICAVARAARFNHHSTSAGTVDRQS